MVKGIVFLALVGSVNGMCLNADGSQSDYFPIQTASGAIFQCTGDADCPTGNTCQTDPGNGARFCCPGQADSTGTTGSKCADITDCGACVEAGCAFDAPMGKCVLTCANAVANTCAITAAQCPTTTAVTGSCRRRCGVQGWAGSNPFPFGRRLAEDGGEEYWKGPAFPLDVDVVRDAKEAADAAGDDKQFFGFGWFPFFPPLPPPPPPPVVGGNNCVTNREPECECWCTKDCASRGNCCFDYSWRCEEGGTL